MINIYKEEYLKLREKKVILQLDQKVNQLKLELFENDNNLLINDDDYNNGIEYD